MSFVFQLFGHKQSKHTKNHKLVVATDWKFRGSPKLLGIIFRALLIFVTHFMTIYSVVANPVWTKDGSTLLKTMKFSSDFETFQKLQRTYTLNKFKLKSFILLYFNMLCKFWLQGSFYTVSSLSLSQSSTIAISKNCTAPVKLQKAHIMKNVIIGSLFQTSTFLNTKKYVIVFWLKFR